MSRTENKYCHYGQNTKVRHNTVYAEGEAVVAIVGIRGVGVSRIEVEAEGVLRVSGVGDG